MLTLGGIIGLYLVSIFIGKMGHRITAGTILLLLLLAIVQTGIVVFDMFSRAVPPQ